MRDAKCNTMKQILLFLLFITTTLSPLSAFAELNLTTSNITNMLPGPATDVFKLLEGLKTDIEAKMGLITPKINLSGGDITNMIQRGSGQSIPDILNSGKNIVQEKISYFNSQSFISTATEFVREMLTWLIETVRKVIGYF